MSESVAVTLPNGFARQDTFSRAARLRALTGSDQLFLAEECQELPPAHWITEVLARCVTRLGLSDLPDHDALRALPVGDRDALLLHLHALLFGERLRCVATCPIGECREKLDLEIKVADLLMPPYAHQGMEHELEFTAPEGPGLRVRFTLPNGADHEAAALAAQRDLEAGVALLLRRCVRAVGEGADDLAETWPPELASTVGARMAELDPQSELFLDTCCPGCGKAFRARLDVAALLRAELTGGAADLYREVHELAFHYHWSAAEILGLSAQSRRRYLRLLDEQLARQPLQ
jgi:hypothetical protein